MTKKPNILFICTDQQRWDTIGRFKPANLRMPNLDNLLQRSVHFTNTFCQSPICQPSRACMLSGQYCSQTGIYTNGTVLPEAKTTYASVLGNNGYVTSCIGRAHGINQGFNFKLPTPLSHSFFEMSRNLNGPEEKWSYDHYDYKTLPYIYEGDFEDYMDVRTTNNACHWLQELRDSQKPWLMFIGLLAPHNPYILPRKYADFYKDDDFDMPTVFEEDFDKPSYTPRDAEFWKRFTPEHIRQTRRIYYSMVSMIDELVGRVLTKLDELGMTEDTIIIFTSDHGEMNGDHGLWAKQKYYDESIKTPSLISYPRVFSGGTESDAMVESIDFMPTLLELAGIEVPDSVAGKSLVPLLNGSCREHKSAVFSALAAHGWYQRCIRTKDFSYSYGYPVNNGLTGELYDLKKDPQQRYNVYDDPDYKQVGDDMMRQLLEFELSHSYLISQDKPDCVWEFPPSFSLC